MSSIFESTDFIHRLNGSKLSAVEKVEVLKKFLADKKDEVDNETGEFIKEELQSFKDMAHFESTTPW